MAEGNGMLVLKNKFDDLKERFSKLNEIVSRSEEKANDAIAISQRNSDKVENMETTFRTELSHAVETLGTKIETIGARQKEQSDRRWKLMTMIIGTALGLVGTALAVYFGLK